MAIEFKHPEQRPGEIFMSNEQNRFASRYATKRYGERAFYVSIECNEMVEARDPAWPLFVQISELRESGIDPADIHPYGEFVKLVYEESNGN